MLQTQPPTSVLAGGTPATPFTLSLLGSSLRTLAVGMNLRPNKASRRVRTTLYRVCYAWKEGSPVGFSRITPLGTPLMESRAHLGQGGDASRIDTSTSPRTPRTILAALPARVGVSSSHTTNSLIGGVQNTCPSETIGECRTVGVPAERCCQ